MDGLRDKKEIIEYYNCKIFYSDFFNRDSLQVARELPDKYLKRNYAGNFFLRVYWY